MISEIEIARRGREKCSPVFGFMVRGEKHTPDSMDLPAEAFRAKIPPKHTTFCHAEQKWREYRAWKPSEGMCPDCMQEHAIAAQALNEKGVSNGNLPPGWTRTR